MSFLRIPVLLVGACLTWKALTPPHTSSQAERLPMSLVGRFALLFVPFMKSAHALSCLTEVALILSEKYSSAAIPKFILSFMNLPALGTRSISITLPFIIGSTLVLAGAQLRMACYRELGRFFTFEMAIRKDHFLVRSGPYAYVRHPAYTGLIMTLAGAVTIQAGTGSWIREYGWFEYKASKAYLLFLAFSSLAVSLGSVMRGLKEDRALKETFGVQWVQWAKDTPYKMFPFIY
ncbi:hypothetical protein H0H81_008777 [Sphagnurus paluster]|uniref:Protein-S-isoprenylcysteine O-methyltransferase n=1 Tax=Sphagnurus paluster TaxID=117069 RepID=A0A9P7GLB1_9AGAR|nr:hypothetical protein H0H81_008777 [Sphagnurus paluster]